jgi:pumilio RNA-binding family
LLDEFRASGGKGRAWEVASLSGAVVAFCLDQHGSRFVQQKLEATSTSVGEKALIFAEVLPRAHELMSDVFGNYVVQKLLEHGTAAQQQGVLRLLQGHVVPLSMQMYGCRVVQKALECCDPLLVVPLARELAPQVLECVADQNGNHVVQKLVEVLSKAGMGDHVQFAVDAFEGQVCKALNLRAYTYTLTVCIQH